MSSPWVRVFVFLTFAGLACGATDDSPNPAFRSNVAEVRLTFFATDQNYRAVTTVKEDDFAVVDRDSVVRNFASFGRDPWKNVEVVVVIDSSDSVSRQFKKAITSSLQLIAQNHGIPDESISIISFHNSKPALICAGNCRSIPVADQLVPEAGELTPLFDSVVLGTDLISRRSDANSKKALILFSDGEDTISMHAATDAMQAAITQDTQIYAVDLNPRSSARGSAVLQRLANATGGRYFVLRQDTEQVLKEVFEDFHAAYTVTYRVPTHAAGFHSVRILPTNNLNLQFHCRSGYEYSASGQ